MQKARDGRGDRPGPPLARWHVIPPPPVHDRHAAPGWAGIPLPPRLARRSARSRPHPRVRRSARLLAGERCTGWSGVWCGPRQRWYPNYGIGPGGGARGLLGWAAALRSAVLRAEREVVIRCSDEDRDPEVITRGVEPDARDLRQRRLVRCDVADDRLRAEPVGVPDDTAVQARGNVVLSMMKAW